MTTTYSVGTPSAAWHRMEAARRIPKLLAGGRDAIIKSSKQETDGVRPLVQGQPLESFVLWHPKETRENFSRRLKLLQYERYYWSAMENLGAMPFTHPVAWAEETPQEVMDWEGNIEADATVHGVAGRDLRSFARWCCAQSAGYGFGGLYSNQVDGADRPYLSWIPGWCILGVDFRNGNNSTRPSRMRIRVNGSKPRKADEGGVDARGEPWGASSFDRILVLYDGDPDAARASDAHLAAFEIYDREEPGDEESPWKTSPTVPWTPLRPQPTIPMSMLYTGFEGWWETPPAQGHLADAEHVWVNKRSDLDSILAVSCVPQWDWAGATEEDAKNHGVIAPGNVWRSTNAGAHFLPREFTGSSMTVSQDDLDRHERRMSASSLAPMVTRPAGNETATGRVLDTQSANTRAEAFAINWADTFSEALQFCAIYRQLPPDAVAKVQVSFHHEFGIRERELKLIDGLTQAYLAGRVRPELWFSEMKRVGGFAEDVIPEDEALWVDQQEASNLASLIGAQAAEGTAPADAPG